MFQPEKFLSCISRRYGKCSNLDRPLRKRCLRATDVTSATRIVAPRAAVQIAPSMKEHAKQRVLSWGMSSVEP
jgi:hypothetical protein